MSKDNTIIQYNDNEIRPRGLLEKYLSLCATGFGKGLIVGAYMGGLVGGGVAASSPAIIGYGLFRGVRKILRK